MQEHGSYKNGYEGVFLRAETLALIKIVACGRRFDERKVRDLLIGI
jgi:hypothetical protein